MYTCSRFPSSVSVLRLCIAKVGLVDYNAVMNKRYDELFDEICSILREDWAGRSLCGEALDLRYYHQAVGQAWHDRKLDDHLFLRYIRQMLACTGDRHLRFCMAASDRYTSCCPGFRVRRYEDCLYVTDARDETRLAAGDRIIRINGGTPSFHRRSIQKNFFYADAPEREDWAELLQMAESIDVIHPDGRQEQFMLRQYPLAEPFLSQPQIHKLTDRTVIDLRNRSGPSEEDLDSFLSLVCRTPTPLSVLTETDYRVNYSRRNCIIRAAAIHDLPGSDVFIAELAEKAGRGYLAESADDGTVIPAGTDTDVYILIDTWTRGNAELLALAGRRAGAFLIGRSTLGTLDLSCDVSYAMDDRYIFTWPTAITSAAARHQGVFGKGVIPDLPIPWSPAECTEDVLLKAAVSLTASSKDKRTAL